MSDIPIQTFESFAAQRGASRQAFGDAGLHRSSRNISRKTWTRMVEAQSAKDGALIEKRRILRQEFDAMVSAGLIREPSRIERLQETAKGDGESAKAAQRLLAKIQNGKDTS